MRSDRGSVFYRCLLSASDSRFPKYPRLPVVSCLGYRPGDHVRAEIPAVSFTNIRKARLDEAASLTTLAIRSKAYWGYDAEFMSKAVPELTLDPDKFGPDFLVFVLAADGRYFGFYSLIPLDSATIELHHLFVDPDHVGTGLGASLWRHAVETARTLNYRTIVLTADPHAEPFYVRRGAVTRAYVTSPIQMDRSLPRMQYQIPAALK
jgi:GNAT superfamily N-acetyltransferase